MDDVALDALERRIDDVGMATAEDAHALIAELRDYRARDPRLAEATTLGVVDARFVGAHVGGR